MLTNRRNSTCTIILGMHKSGTTMVSKVLHKSGIQMLPRTQHEAAAYDLGAQFEWKEFKAINCKLLNCEKKASLDINVDGRLLVSPAVQAEAAGLVSTITADDWGFKDPRTTLTYGFWRSQLPQHRVIAIFRHPAEVILHYLQYYKENCRQTESSYIDTCLEHWMAYNSRIIEIIESARVPSLLLPFSGVLGSVEDWRRLESFVGRRCCDERDLSLYRCKIDTEIPKEAAGVWRRLVELSR